jgi:uncharacterized membrane protein YeaQ/YmgE (transglycosylase-associated protein family)
MTDEGIKNNDGNEAESEMDEKKIPLTNFGKGVVAILALYLLILLISSLSWFASLMFADTNDPDNANLSLVKCIAKKGTPTPTPTPSPANASNSNTNVANSNVNANSARPASNSSTGANANGTTDTTAPGGSVTPTPKATATPTPSPTPAKVENGKGDDGRSGNKADNGEEEAFNLKITRVVTVDKDSFWGSLFSITSFTQSGCITADGYLFLIVLFGGMIGAIVRALIYLCWRVGTEKFSLTWSWYYLFQPFIGAAMAIVVYVVIRGGFNGGAIGKGNIYSFAAVAFLTALFSDNAMAKLKLIAESLLVKVDSKPKADDKKKNGGDPDGGGTGGTKPAPTRPAANRGVSDGGRTPGSMAPDEPPV